MNTRMQSIRRMHRQFSALSIGIVGVCVLLAAIARTQAAPTAQALNKDAVQVALGHRMRFARAEGVTADVMDSAATLERDLDPVIVKGVDIGNLTGSPIDELFTYVYTGGAWTQIPSQVDPVTVSGTYTPTEDGLLDDNDELVFMAKDLGDRVPAGMSVRDTLPVSAGWYEIEVTDPLNPTRKAWAYVIHSSVLTPTFADDYVSFDGVAHRISGTSYSLGFATPRPWADHFAFQPGGQDIIDRTKIRLLCERKLDPRTWLCPITEDKLLPIQDNLIVDGPVRVIVRGGKVLAYASLATWTTALDIPSYLEGDVRFSLDFSLTVTGATYYNAAIPGGAIVDGITDTVPATPLSLWWQVSTSDGTLIQASDTSALGGTQSNYYSDSSDIDPLDTGDQRRYADTGVYVSNPNSSITYTFALYALPGQQPSVGATYQEYFRRPLSVAASTPLCQVYLPVVLDDFSGGAELP